MSKTDEIVSAIFLLIEASKFAEVLEVLDEEERAEIESIVRAAVRSVIER